MKPIDHLKKMCQFFCVEKDKKPTPDTETAEKLAKLKAKSFRIRNGGRKTS